MAEIQQQQGNRRTRRNSFPVLRVDMTPMVDLAFLLLTFFVLTSELKKENAIVAKFPVISEETTSVNNGLTLLIEKDPGKIFWYRGKFDPSMHLNVVKAEKNGLFNVLSNANSSVYNQIEVIDRQHKLGLLNDKTWLEKRSALLGMNSIPFVIVKWDTEASYGTVVDAIDDLNRSHNNKYTIVPVTDAEKTLLDKVNPAKIKRQNFKRSIKQIRNGRNSTGRRRRW